MKRLLTLLALVLPLTAPAAAQPRAGAGQPGARHVERRFQDWLLVCDNVRVCRAQPTGVSGGQGSLMIRRDPGPNGAIMVMLDGQQPGNDANISDLGTIRVDGNGGWRGWRLNREAAAATLEGAPALPFVRLLASARAVTYRAGAETLSVSLTGLAAALRTMDEVQGRTGTVTASLNPGPRPAATVPAAGRLPVLWVPRPPATTVPRGFAAAVRRTHRAALRRADCEDDAPGNDEAYVLGRTELLVILRCRLYNTSAGGLLLRAPRSAPGRARVVILPRPPGEDGPGDDGVYSDVEWDPRTVTLFAGAHSCAGTCGFRTRWTFDGRSFLLAEHFTYEAGGGELLNHYRAIIRIRR